MERREYIPPEPKKAKKAPAFKLSYKFLLYKFFFPHLKNRGKREYFGVIIRRSSTYLAIAYGFSILFGSLLFFLTDINEISNIIWSPDQILVLPFAFAFIADTSMVGDPTLTFITNYIVTIILPFLIAGTIAGILWRDEARDLILVSSSLLFLLFLLVHLSQELLSTFFANIYVSIIYIPLYFGFLIVYALSYLIFSALGGYVGARFGKLLTNISFTKKGAKVAYSHLILPEMPISAKTIFDLRFPTQQEDMEFRTLSLVYLNQRVQKIIRRSHTKTCPYFEDGRCAYLGYLTSSHKYQICITEFWPLCKIYSFLSQSKEIIEENNQGDIIG